MLPLRHIGKKKKFGFQKKYDTTLFDKFMYVVSFVGPVMTIPQIYDLWVTKSAVVNPLTWASYLTVGFVWLFYGIVHKEKIIIFSNMVGIVTTGLVFVGAIMYR